MKHFYNKKGRKIALLLTFMISASGALPAHAAEPAALTGEQTLVSSSTVPAQGSGAQTNTSAGTAGGSNATADPLVQQAADQALQESKTAAEQAAALAAAQKAAEEAAAAEQKAREEAAAAAQKAAQEEAEAAAAVEHAELLANGTIHEAYDATDEERKLLAALIFCEAGNQSHEGMVAVGNVVINRVRSHKFPDTIKEVIYQSGQFSPACSGWLNSVLRGGGIPDSCFEAADEALSGATPVGNAVYFSRGSRGGQVIGAHVFSGTM